jgi:hypothetical protein
MCDEETQTGEHRRARFGLPLRSKGSLSLYVPRAYFCRQNINSLLLQEARPLLVEI